MKKITLCLTLVFLYISGYSQSLVLNTNDLTPLSEELGSIDPSKDGELTIASLNIRDMRGTTRTLENFQYLADLLDEADIIVLQEVGAKGYSSESKVNSLNKRIEAFSLLFTSFLGSNWNYVRAPIATPEYLGMGAEIPLVFYKESTGQISIDCYWKEYVDLGEKRDMGVFTLYLSNGEERKAIDLGTIHTKPTCPERGRQLLKVSEYISIIEKPTIICGDFNWGYKSESSCEIRFEGEESLLELEQEGLISLPFSDISYLGSGDEDDFRTNLMIRKSVQFYDQFILSKYFIDKYADNCSLSEDCGFISISQSDEFKSIVDDEIRTRLKGARIALKLVEDDCSIDREEQLEKVEKEIEKDWRVHDAASYILSDHKPIWVQIKPFSE